MAVLLNTVSIVFNFFNESLNNYHMIVHRADIFENIRCRLKNLLTNEKSDDLIIVKVMNVYNIDYIVCSYVGFIA